MISGFFYLRTNPVLDGLRAHLLVFSLRKLDATVGLLCYLRTIDS